MDKIELLSGILLTPLKIIKSPLGNVYHGLKKPDSGFYGFEEAYFSTVAPNVIKPWKKHTKMTLNLIVPVGEIRFVLFDDRGNSETHGLFMDISLSTRNYQRLTVPPNIWLAFMGVGDDLNLLLNIANMEHDPDEIIRKDLDAFKYKW